LACRRLYTLPWQVPGVDTNILLLFLLLMTSLLREMIITPAKPV
jgi:hypothetical protein